MKKVGPENTEIVSPKKALALCKRQDVATKDWKQKELKQIEVTLNELQGVIVAFAASLLLSMVLAGRRLLIAKKLQSHGEYTQWIENNFKGRISVRTAQRYTNLASFAENNMHRLRDVLTEINGNEVVELSDDQVLAKLPASKVFELIAYDKKDSTSLQKPGAPTRALDIRFAAAIAEFLGSPDLVLTTTTLSDGEIESPEIATGKDPAKDRKDWPNTVVAILASGATAQTTGEALGAAFDAKVVKEALLLMAADQLDSKSLIARPQLHFTACHPFVATAGKISEHPMTLLLISDVDRLADFAKAFRSLGIVKVPFVPETKNN